MPKFRREVPNVNNVLQLVVWFFYPVNKSIGNVLGAKHSPRVTTISNILLGCDTLVEEYNVSGKLI